MGFEPELTLFERTDAFDAAPADLADAAEDVDVLLCRSGTGMVRVGVKPGPGVDPAERGPFLRLVLDTFDSADVVRTRGDKAPPGEAVWYVVDASLLSGDEGPDPVGVGGDRRDFLSVELDAVERMDVVMEGAMDLGRPAGGPPAFDLGELSLDVEGGSADEDVVLWDEEIGVLLADVDADADDEAAGDFSGVVDVAEGTEPRAAVRTDVMDEAIELRLDANESLGLGSSGSGGPERDEALRLRTLARRDGARLVESVSRTDFRVDAWSDRMVVFFGVECA